MKIGRYILLIAAIGNSALLCAQGLLNEGRMNVAGNYLVIIGNYQNESSGDITLDGTISVSGNWTNNGSTKVIANPGTNGEVIFNGTGTQIIGGSANEFDFEKLTINSGSKTQVTSGKGVTVYGTATLLDTLVLKTTTTAFRPQMATFINKGSVSGNITMEFSYTSTGSSASGTGRGLYFSSPISNATSTIFNVAAASNLLWYQNEITRQYVKITTNATPLTLAKGYILRAPTSNVFKFSGPPNTNASYSNTNIPRAVTGQFYLFGNPYPAVIDWTTLVKSNLTNTIWYNTSTTSGSMVVDTWNKDPNVGTNNNGTAAVDGKIAPMQSFWVQCSDVGLIGSLTVNESDRTHDWGNSQFLKSPAKTSNSKDLLRLYLYSGNKRDEALVLLSDAAQDNFDSWDSRKMLLKDPNRAEMYTISPEKINLVIQSVKPITNNKTIRLGLYVGTAGEYKIVANLAEASNSNNIFLVDKQLNITQDLKTNPEYTFTSDITDDTSRFILNYLQAPTVITNNPQPICSPATVDLTSGSMTAGSTEGLTYTYWTDAAATVLYPTPATAGSGTYYIKGTAANGSYTISNPIVVTINPTPIVVTNNPPSVIAPETVNLTAPEITLGSTEGLSYSYWLDSYATIPYLTPQTALAGNYFIKGVVQTTGCFSIAGPVAVIINSSTTIAPSLLTDEVSVYSFENQIHINNCEPGSTIAIYDIVGIQCYLGISKSNNEIIISSFKTGIYIVKIINNHSVNSKKIYVQ